jgi:hypothetical protein
MREAEFRAFSQWGEDGIIQWLISRVPIESETFVEFGVQSYREANTRFLLEHDNWRGLILDSGTAHRRYVESSGLRWRHSIDPVTAFITTANINELLQPMAGNLGLLSIDIDGNDYWVWEAITVQPRIVIVEYNSVFGSTRAVSIPYDPAFDRHAAHHSGLYFGASLPALAHLASKLGYQLVGSNLAGNNAFFVRRDLAGELRDLTAADAWRESRFRDSRDERGVLSYVDSHADRLAVMDSLPLVDVISGERLTAGELVRD